MCRFHNTKFYIQWERLVFSTFLIKINILIQSFFTLVYIFFIKPYDSNAVFSSLKIMLTKQLFLNCKKPDTNKKNISLLKGTLPHFFGNSNFHVTWKLKAVDTTGNLYFVNTEGKRGFSVPFIIYRSPSYYYRIFCLYCDLRNRYN